MKKSVLAIALAVLMAVSLLTIGAMADGVKVNYKDDDGKIKTCESAIVLTADSKGWTEGWYVAKNNLSIGERVTVSGNVRLILKSGCTLEIEKGIYVPSGASLTIYGQKNDTGKLNISGYQNVRYAGIGGNTDDEAAHGTITINGGNITAKGGFYAAGIGSGYGRAEESVNGDITINGGTIIATGGGEYGAGIGGGYVNKISGGNILITGGNVTATGGKYAAGIGGGYSDYQKNGRTITINGNASVTATGGEAAAGIGNGYGGGNFKRISSITINGRADVKAYGGKAGGAGIGGSYGNAGTTGRILIGGSATVMAIGGGDDSTSYGGAGIGSGGGFGKSGAIVITGGTVNATGGKAAADDYSGAGIGSGGYGSSGAITISAGNVTATSGGEDAYGIGDGTNGSSGDFSTVRGDNPGKAMIITDSISDSDDTSGWSCIVKSGNDITVYGDIELDNDLVIGENEKLIITEGSTLTIPKGVTVTNSGSIVNNGVVNGSVSDGLGKTCTYITLADSVVYNGTITYDVGNAVITVGSKNVGAYSPVVGNEPGENEYIATAKEGYVLNPLGTLTINKAPLTITAKDMAAIAGDPVPTYSYEVSGLLEEDKLDKGPVLSCKVDMNVPGSYDIIASGAEAANYEITYVNGTLTVQPAWYVTLVFNNGSPDEVINILKGGTITLPTPTNSGYIFLGWRDNNNVTHKADEVVTITANTTFTAVWGNLPDVKPSEPSEPETPVFPFYDVTARDWYYSAVKYVYEKGLMDGVDAGVFAPDDTLTRAMVWTIIARAEGVDTTGGATWYAKAQEWVTAKGISDGENPNAPITRQELVTMLYRLAGEPAVSGTITAPDASSVSSWAQSAMTWAMNIGLVEGDENGAVTPTATATRAQAAALIMRYLEA